MPPFRTRLVSGKKRPYKSWTFVVVPQKIATTWGPGQKAVRGLISGHTFQGTASRGEGVMRVPISRDFREQTQLSRGDTVEVELELDRTPRPVVLPVELQTVFKRNRDVAELYEKLSPSMRRAWATYVTEAKLSETRTRRAGQAVDGICARAYP